jgi:hypothetical protein
LQQIGSLESVYLKKTGLQNINAWTTTTRRALEAEVPDGARASANAEYKMMTSTEIQYKKECAPQKNFVLF